MGKQRSMKTTLNFGALKDTITKKASLEMAQENRNTTLVNFMEAVRKSPVLKKQFLIYKNFENTKPFEHARLAERFIEQNLQVIRDVSWEDLQDQNAHLRQNILGGPDECTVMATKANEALFEHVNTLIESKLNKRFTRFDKDAQSYGALVEHLTRSVPAQEANTEKERPEVNRFWKYITKNALNYFNERYEALTDEERELFKMMISETKEKKEGVVRLREDLIALVDSKLKEAKAREDVVILESFKEKLTKEVPEEKMMSDEYIMSCFELKQTLLKR